MHPPGAVAELPALFDGYGPLPGVTLRAARPEDGPFPCELLGFAVGRRAGFGPRQLLQIRRRTPKVESPLRVPQLTRRTRRRTADRLPHRGRCLAAAQPAP
jgi:hypothetical protein